MPSPSRLHSSHSVTFSADRLPETNHLKPPAIRRGFSFCNILARSPKSTCFEDCCWVAGNRTLKRIGGLGEGFQRGLLDVGAIMKRVPQQGARSLVHVGSPRHN